AIGSQGEADDRLAESPLLHTRRFEIASADGNSLIDGVILDARGAAELVFARSGEDLHFVLEIRRNGGLDRLRIRRRIPFDHPELQLRCRLDDVFDARRVIDAGKLNDDAVLTLRGDDRLSDFEVETAPDRLGVVLRRDQTDPENHKDGDNQAGLPHDTSIQDFLRSMRAGSYSVSPLMTLDTAERATLIFTFSAIFR